MKRILVIFLGIVFVIVGIYVLVKENATLKRCTQKTTGTIVDIVEEWSTDSDGDRTLSYYPVISYQAGGITVTKQSNIDISDSSKISIKSISVSSNKTKMKINDNVTVFYNPNNVEEFFIDGEQKLNYLGAILFVFSGLFVTIAGIVKKSF